MTDSTETTSTPGPRPRWRRRLFKLLIGVAIGLLLVVVGVQLFLWSDYPRQIGIQVAQKLTRLRVEMGALTVRWDGATSIRDLSVSLPLEDRPFLVVPRVELRHTSLVGIVFTQDVVIRRVEVDRPVVSVRQDQRGVWNLQQALNQVRAPAQNVATIGPPLRGAASIHLPDITLRDARVEVTTRDGSVVTIDQVGLAASNDGPLAWRFSANAGTLARASGSVTPAGRWPHDLHAEVDSLLLKQLRPILGDVVDRYTARAVVDWIGERTANGVTGRLMVPVDGIEVGPLRAAGAAVVNVDGRNLAVEPAGLKLDVSGLPQVELAGGRITYAGAGIRADELRVRFADGSIRLSGQGDLDAIRARVEASWERVAFPVGATHQGTLAIDVASLWPGRPQVSALVETRGEMAGRTFDTRVRVDGSGQRWTDADFVIELARTRLSDDRGVSAAVEGAKVTVHTSDRAVEIVGLQLPNRPASPSAELRGAYTFAGDGAGAWWAYASLRAPANVKYDYRGHLNAYGDSIGATLNTLYAAIGEDVWASASGLYRYGDSEPVVLHIDAEADPTAAVDEPAVRSLMAGRLGLSATLRGTQQPLNLRLAGHARSRQFRFRQFDLGTSDLRFEGQMLPDFVNLQTNHLQLFGGEGWMELKYPYFAETLLAQLALDGIDMRQIGEAVGLEDITGRLNGRIAIDVPVESPRSLHGSGELVIDHLAVAPLISTQRVTVPIGVRDEWVQIQPTAMQAGGGKASIDLVTTFAEPTRFQLKATLHDWLTSLPTGDLHARTGGSIDLSADVVGQTARGTIALDNTFGAGESPIGRASLRVGIDHHTVTLHQLAGNVLDGTILGDGVINIDELEHARLSIGMTGLSLDRLAELTPQVGEVKGNLSVRLHVEPTRSDRPLGPVEMRFLVESDRATFKGVEIGNTHIGAFLDRDRLVLSDDPEAPNRIAFAGGTVGLWGRISSVPVDMGRSGAAPGREPSLFIQLRPDDLDAEQLNRIIDPDGKATPGRISGEITAFGNPLAYDTFTADGRLTLRNSDFANVGLFAVLYDAMRLGTTIGEPLGYGDLTFRLQGGRLVVPEFSYFNRSVYATASLRLDDVFAFGQSPVEGYIIGTFRPLKDLELPFLADLDQIGDALQRNATTLAISGTLDEVKATPSSLKAFGSDFRNLLLGQTRHAK